MIDVEHLPFASLRSFMHDFPILEPGSVEPTHVGQIRVETLTDVTVYAFPLYLGDLGWYRVGEPHVITKSRCQCARCRPSVH